AIRSQEQETRATTALAETREAYEGTLPLLEPAGIQLSVAGQYAEAEKILRQSLVITNKLYPPAQFPDGHPPVAKSLPNPASVLQWRGKYAEAEAACREAVAMYQRLHRDRDHPDVVASLSSLGVILKARGKFTDSEETLTDALETSRRLYPNQDHPEVATR